MSVPFALGDLAVTTLMVRRSMTGVFNLPKVLWGKPEWSQTPSHFTGQLMTTNGRTYSKSAIYYVIWSHW